MSDTAKFSGLWAVILGGSGGFGFAAMERLARAGMHVAVLYRETAAADRQVKTRFAEVARQHNVTIAPFNINALDAVGRDGFLQQFEQLVPQKNSVKLLLHSIARGNLKPLYNAGGAELSADDIQMTSYAMSNSLLDWARMLLQAGMFNADARIIGLTSDGAHKFWHSYAAVSVAKASLESLAKYMAVEFGPLGIKTNLVQAGVTETASLKMIADSDKLIQMADANNPLGRITRTTDVADVIYMLCTDEARWINGALIHVDGGEHCL